MKIIPFETPIQKENKDTLKLILERLNTMDNLDAFVFIARERDRNGDAAYYFNRTGMDLGLVGALEWLKGYTLSNISGETIERKPE